MDHRAPGGPLRELLVFSSTPDVDEDNFVVPVLAADVSDLGWRARELGFDGLEFLPNPDAMPDPSRLLDGVQSAGLTVGVVNSGRLRPKGYALLHKDAVVRRKSIDVFKTLIELAGAIGARVGLGMARGDSETTVEDAELKDVMHDVFVEIAEHATTHRTLVMLEPADPGYVAAILRVSEAVDAVRHVNNPGFGMMLDTYQLDQVEDSIDDGFRNAAGLASHIHLYDRRHWSPGLRNEERLDWDLVRESMNRHGFSGSGSTVLPKEGDVANSCRRSTAFLRRSLMRSVSREI